MLGLSNLAAKVIIGLAAVALIVGILWLNSCQSARQKAAEARLERSQAEAQQNSAADAIETQGTVNGRSQASEDLTRSNEEEIRHAKGADAPVDAGVRDAGLASLCRRAAYRDSPRCRMFRADPAGVETGR